jgi:hypothetical protein
MSAANRDARSMAADSRRPEGLLAHLDDAQREQLWTVLCGDVHDSKGNEAARINNGGLEEQVAFLGADAVLDALEELGINEPGGERATPPPSRQGAEAFLRGVDAGTDRAEHLHFVCASDPLVAEHLSHLEHQLKIQTETAQREYECRLAAAKVIAELRARLEIYEPAHGGASQATDARDALPALSRLAASSHEQSKEAEREHTGAMPMPTGYEDDIIRATGCAKQDAPLIEDIMRKDILHSTLDWISAERFAEVAREAAAMLPDYKAALAYSRKLFPEPSKEGAADGPHLTKKLSDALAHSGKREKGRER